MTSERMDEMTKAIEAIDCAGLTIKVDGKEMAIEGVIPEHIQSEYTPALHSVTPCDTYIARGPRGAQVIVRHNTDTGFADRMDRAGRVRTCNVEIAW